MPPRAQAERAQPTPTRWYANWGRSSPPPPASQRATRVPNAAPRECDQLGLPLRRLHALGGGRPNDLTAPRGTPGSGCGPEVTYRPAPIEKWWYAYVDLCGWNEFSCAHVRHFAPQADEWLGAAAARTTFKPPGMRRQVQLNRDVAVARAVQSGLLASATSSAPYLDTLSHHVFRDTCTNATRVVPIEPLYSFLRHPDADCLAPVRHPGFWPSLLRRDWLLPQTLTDMLAPPPRCMLFDLGASLWNRGAGGASLGAMVELYAARGLRFGRIFAWEAHNYTDLEIYDVMPAPIADIIHYYNVPVDPAPGHKYNPLRTIAAVATPQDFVVLKLDLDVNHIEESLVAQILASPQLLGLVDEMYFEHHVRNSPMWRHGWHVTTEPTDRTLSDSYSLFSRLRQAGVRAHSWI